MNIQVITNSKSNGFISSTLVHPSRVYETKGLIGTIQAVDLPEEYVSKIKFGDDDAPEGLLPHHFGGFRQKSLDFLASPK